LQLDLTRSTPLPTLLAELGSAATSAPGLASIGSSAHAVRLHRRAPFWWPCCLCLLVIWPAKRPQPLGAIDLLCWACTSLVLLALQWECPVEAILLGSFLADNLAVAFRAVVAASNLAFAVLISCACWSRAARRGWKSRGDFVAATLGAMFPCAVPLTGQPLVALEISASVSSYLLSALRRDARSGRGRN